jgi:hypothetical protein
VKPSKVSIHNFDTKNFEKNLDKTLFTKDLQKEEEGLYRIFIKEVFGKFLEWFINRSILMSFSETLCQLCDYLLFYHI